MENIKIALMCGLTFCLMIMFSCKKFLSVDAPKDQINTEKVYSSNETATAAVRGIYSQMIALGGFASGNSLSVTFLVGRSADDFNNFSSNIQNIQFSDSSILPENTSLRTGLWQQPYQLIYYSNAVIENLEKSNMVSIDTKKQLNGEAKFIRAFCYLYLTNLFGNVPLIITTDYRENAVASRTSQEEIYTQIVKDLTEAKNDLSKSYPSIGRTRPNKYAAAALLARVYLYRKDWIKAENEATEVIMQADQYKILNDLDQVFLKGSEETIFQLAAPSTLNINTYEGARYILTTGTPTGSNEVVLNEDLFAAFELGDQRSKNWIGTYQNGTTILKYVFKYKNKTVTTPINEYSVVMRLAEQYLIRSEARINQDRIIEGVEDLNYIRSRARAVPNMNVPNPLPNLSTAINKSSALLAVEKERRTEFFAEWGHRWIDLKRTGRADVVLAQSKGSNWQNTDVLYPIPATEILNDPKLTQNPGYQ